MKCIMLTTLFFLFSVNLYSQEENNLPPLVDISTELNLEKGNVFLDTSIVEVDYFLNTYTPEEYYDAMYIYGKWDITTKESMFDYSDLNWDEKLDLNKVKNKYENFVQDLIELSNSLILKTKYFEEWDIEINETNFIITYGELVNAQQVLNVLSKYELRDLYYIFHSPINVETNTTSVDVLNFSNYLELKIDFSNGILNINSDSEYLESIEIFDLNGNKVHNSSSINTLNYNTITHLSSGVYFLLINDKQIIKLSITE